MGLGASLRATLSVTIFPKRIHLKHRKWIEKSNAINYNIAIGKDFHYNRWRKRKTLKDRITKRHDIKKSHFFK